MVDWVTNGRQRHNTSEFLLPSPSTHIPLSHQNLALRFRSWNHYRPASLSDLSTNLFDPFHSNKFDGLVPATPDPDLQRHRHQSSSNSDRQSRSLFRSVSVKLPRSVKRFSRPIDLPQFNIYIDYNFLCIVILCNLIPVLVVIFSSVPAPPTAAINHEFQVTTTFISGAAQSLLKHRCHRCSSATVYHPNTVKSSWTAVRLNL